MFTTSSEAFQYSKRRSCRSGSAPCLSRLDGRPVADPDVLPLHPIHGPPGADFVTGQAIAVNGGRMLA